MRCPVRADDDGLRCAPLAMLVVVLSLWMAVAGALRVALRARGSAPYNTVLDRLDKEMLGALTVWWFLRAVSPLGAFVFVAGRSGWYFVRVALLVWDNGRG